MSLSSKSSYSTKGMLDVAREEAGESSRVENFLSSLPQLERPLNLKEREEEGNVNYAVVGQAWVPEIFMFAW